jgi:hypothetical protein
MLSNTWPRICPVLVVFDHQLISYVCSNYQKTCLLSLFRHIPESCLIHAAGVIPNVLVESRVYQGEFMQFDGRDLGVFNWNNYILFTHEVLEEFLDLSCNNRMTHKGYIRAKIDTWIRSIMYGPKTLDVNVSVRKINLIARIRGQIITAL